MNALFITGTDTGVGKTVVTGILARLLQDKGYKVITQKWIQTGCRGFSSDIREHLKIMSKSESEIRDYLDLVFPYTFKLAASPHLASKLEKKRIKAQKIIRSFKALAKRFDFVIVEGIGGALVPYDEKHLVIDIAKKLKLPVLVVAQNKLGAINHTLLTIEALKKRRMKILGILFNDAKGTSSMVLKDNPKIIKSLTKEKILGVLPWMSGLKKT
ncbi:MAG TPA: dethiobiotin synthase [Candidatus Omnitrophota bacterium]|nr:dethiobiotin synthase [Candidatus Omnitrophota bacterium]